MSAKASGGKPLADCDFFVFNLNRKKRKRKEKNCREARRKSGNDTCPAPS